MIFGKFGVVLYGRNSLILAKSNIVFNLSIFKMTIKRSGLLSDLLCDICTNTSTDDHGLLREDLRDCQIYLQA